MMELRDGITSLHGIHAYLLTDPLCSCMCATNCPLGLQLAGGGLLSHVAVSRTSLVVMSFLYCRRFFASKVRTSSLQGAECTVINKKGHSNC